MAGPAHVRGASAPQAILAHVGGLVEGEVALPAEVHAGSKRLSGWMQMCILACGLYIAPARIVWEIGRSNQINFLLGFLVFGKETSFFLLVTSTS